MTKKIFFPLISLYLVGLLFGNFNLLAQERRRSQDQISKEFGFYIAPFIGRTAGIGTFYGVASSFWNIAETKTDFTLVKAFGDVELDVYYLSDLYWIEDTLKSNLVRVDVKNVVLDQSLSRGVDRDSSDSVKVQAKGNFLGGGLGLSLLEKKISFSGTYGKGSFNVESFRDTDLNEIQFSSELFDSQTAEFQIFSVNYTPAATIEDDSQGLQYQYTQGRVTGDAFFGELSSYGAFAGDFQSYEFSGNYTDDDQDPRSGFQFGLLQNNYLPSNEDMSTMSRINSKISLYFPIGDFSTWVFNVFTSDAEVHREGITDTSEIRSKILKSDCSSLSGTEKTNCEELETKILNYFAALQKYGQSTSLGGSSRLRSYSNSRFIGSHSRFWGTEIRWNLTDEKSDFNYGFLGGIRNALQLAFFYETGSVVDEMRDLEKDARSSYGIGARVVLSGFVGRVDYAYGIEGGELTVLAGYPW